MRTEPPIDAIELLKELRDTTPIMAQRKLIDAILAMGDAGKADSSLFVPPSPARSEISMVSDEELLAVLIKAIDGGGIGKGCEGDTVFLPMSKVKRLAKFALKAVHPYLATRKPVSVSLEETAARLEPAFFGEAAYDWDHDHAAEMRAKARLKAKEILDAAGVKYVE